MRAKKIILVLSLLVLTFALQISLAQLTLGPGITLTPQTQTRNVGDQAQIGATFYYVAINGSTPLVNQTIVFFVISGPNQNVSATAMTNAQGQATFTYTGTAPGVDTVRARDAGFTTYSNDVTVNWICPPPPPPPCIPEGLTPGFWKNNAINWDANWWAPPYTPSTTLTAAGFVTNTVSGSTTMLAALQFTGGPGVMGAEQILLRAAVAALLNSVSGSINYSWSAAHIKSAVNAAIATGDRTTMLSLAMQLDTFNNFGASLSINNGPY